MERDSLLRLQATLQQKQAEDQALLESQTQQVLEQHAQRLSALSSAELRAFHQRIGELRKPLMQSITSGLADAREQTRQLQVLTRRAWIKVASVGLALVLGLVIGTAGLMAFLTGRVSGQLSQSEELAKQISQQHQTLADLQARTGGIDLKNTSRGRFLVYPAGVEEPDLRLWRIEGRRAIRLSD